jgi:hypothetical protein
VTPEDQSNHVLRVIVAEWVVECRTTDPDVLAEFHRVLGPAPAAPDGQDATIVIDAIVQSPESMPPRDGWTMVETEEGIALWTVPDGAGLTIGPSQAMLLASSAEFRFPGVEHARRSVHTFVTAAINHAARVRGFVPAHSALIGVDGVWMLLLGSSGVGKSTSCLAASTAGHLVASDDTCVLRCADGALLGHGLPRAPSLPKAAHGLDAEGPVDYRDRSSVPDFPLVQGWQQISGVLVLRHGTEPLSVLGSAAAMDVIEALTESVAGALSVDVVVDEAPSVLQAATRLPARSMALGADASTRLASVDEALRTAAEQFSG